MKSSVLNRQIMVLNNWLSILLYRSLLVNNCRLIVQLLRLLSIVLRNTDGLRVFLRIPPDDVLKLLIRRELHIAMRNSIPMTLRLNWENTKLFMNNSSRFTLRDFVSLFLGNLEMQTHNLWVAVCFPHWKQCTESVSRWAIPWLPGFPVLFWMRHFRTGIN